MDQVGACHKALCCRQIDGLAGRGLDSGKAGHGPLQVLVSMRKSMCMRAGEADVGGVPVKQHGNSRGAAFCGRLTMLFFLLGIPGAAERTAAGADALFPGALAGHVPGGAIAVVLSISLFPFANNFFLWGGGIHELVVSWEGTRWIAGKAHGGRHLFRGHITGWSMEAGHVWRGYAAPFSLGGGGSLSSRCSLVHWPLAWQCRVPDRCLALTASGSLYLQVKAVHCSGSQRHMCCLEFVGSGCGKMGSPYNTSVLLGSAVWAATVLQETLGRRGHTPNVRLLCCQSGEQG
jgi:hypothetical protein